MDLSVRIGALTLKHPLLAASGFCLGCRLFFLRWYVPDLFARIKPTLSGLLPQNWRKPENQVLKPWARAVITTWVLIVVPLLIATLVLMVVTFPRLAGTAWDAAGLQYRELVAAAAAGDGAAVALEVLSIAAIALRRTDPTRPITR